MKSVLKFIKNKMVFVGAIMVAAIVGSASTAVVMAAIPDSGGVIHACRTTLTGGVRIIDSASQSCNGLLETSINWDQFNPPQGSQFGELVSLTGKNVAGMDFRFLNMSDQDFTNTNLSNTNLSGSDFSNSNLTGADLGGLNSDHINFSGATFTNAWLLSGGSLASSNFSNANMANVDIGGMILTDSNFSNANFTNASFTTVNFDGSIFSSATLTGATWDDVTCPDGTNSNDHSNTCVGHLTP